MYRKCDPQSARQGGESGARSTQRGGASTTLLSVHMAETADLLEHNLPCAHLAGLAPHLRALAQAVTLLRPWHQSSQHKSANILRCPPLTLMHHRPALHLLGLHPVHTDHAHLPSLACRSPRGAAPYLGLLRPLCRPHAASPAHRPSLTWCRPCARARDHLAGGACGTCKRGGQFGFSRSGRRAGKRNAADEEICCCMHRCMYNKCLSLIVAPRQRP